VTLALRDQPEELARQPQRHRRGTINVEKSVVFISLSDKMLFSSGSTTIGPSAKAVLAKVATVVNDKPNMDVLIEGHTDNVPISKDCIKDNWDLSVMRATAITRVFTTELGVDPIPRYRRRSQPIRAARGQRHPRAPRPEPPHPHRDPCPRSTSSTT
jgi:flagellar motor protein MotB